MAEFFDVTAEVNKINALVDSVDAQPDLGTPNAGNSIHNLVSEVSSLAHSPVRLQATVDELNASSSSTDHSVATVSFVKDACGNVQAVDFLTVGAASAGYMQKNLLIDMSADLKCDKQPLQIEQLKAK